MIDLKRCAWIALLFTFLLGGCDYNNLRQTEESLGGGLELGNGAGLGGGGGAIVACDEEAPDFSYQRIREEILVPKCFNCHGGGLAFGGVSLDTYESAVAWANVIRFEVESGQMPPPGLPGLSDEERALVLAWVDTGVPALPPAVEECEEETEGIEIPSPAPTPEPEPEMISFADVKSQVFQTRCLICHSSAAGNVAGINLETYENVLNVLTLVKATLDAGTMPPAAFPPLSNEERALVLDWIEAGAPLGEE